MFFWWLPPEQDDELQEVFEKQIKASIRFWTDVGNLFLPQAPAHFDIE